MSGPLVSVVVPTRDRAAVLPRTLGSVLGQTWRELELIVVDDGSTDGTRDYVLGLGDSRVRYERRGPPHGVSRARNRGAALARGEFLAFNDAGDSWAPEKLAVQVAALRGLPESVAMAYSSLIRVLPGDREQRLDCPVFRHDAPDLARRALALGVSGIYPQAALIRTAAFRALGGFDEDLRAWEDLEFFIRLAQRYRIEFVPGHLTSLFDDSRGVSRNMEAVYAAHLRILDKHAGALGGDPRLLMPHFRAAGRRLLHSSQDAYARQALWKVARSPEARPMDWTWLALAYSGRPVFRLIQSLRRAWWRVRGAPDFKTNAGVEGP